MKKNPEISIIVPVYNAEKYLDNCIGSIYAQTFTDYEIILVNDGSTDSSGEICRRYAARDERITYIEKENGGAGSARNAGMSAAKGRYLAFPDADDSFEPQMYEELYALAESGDYDMVFSGVQFFRQTGDGKTAYSSSLNIDAVRYHDRDACRRNVMTFFPTTTIFDVPWNKLYKRSVVTENDIRFTDIRRCQDAMFNLDFFNHINSAASVDKAYYHYMENTAADSQRKFPMDYLDIIVFYYGRLRAILSSWGVYSGAIKEHYDSSFILSVYEEANRFDNPRWGLDNQQRRKYIEDCFLRKEVTGFLPTAQVREDVLPVLEIVKNCDVDRVIRLHNKEKRKESLRHNKLLIGIYRKLKG